LGDPTDSNATAGLALRVTGTHKPLYHGKVEIPTKGSTKYRNGIHDNGKKMLSNKTSKNQGNVKDLKCEIAELKTLLHIVKRERVAETITSIINKWSLECTKMTAQDDEVITSVVKWTDIVKGRKRNQRNEEERTFHEIPTIVNGLVSLNVSDERTASGYTTLSKCGNLVSECRNVTNHKKDHKILIIGGSHARGCASRVKDHLNGNF
jgi:hypothetical protein